VSAGGRLTSQVREVEKKATAEVPAEGAAPAAAEAAPPETPAAPSA
jgi:hypothetical protein